MRGGNDIFHADPGYLLEGVTWGLGQGDSEAGAATFDQLSVRGGQGSDLILGGSESDVLVAGTLVDETTASKDVMAGGPGNDVILGSPVRNWLFGDDIHLSSDEELKALLSSIQAGTPDLPSRPQTSATPSEYNFVSNIFEVDKQKRYKIHPVLENATSTVASSLNMSLAPALEGLANATKLERFEEAGDLNGDQVIDYLGFGKSGSSYVFFGPLPDSTLFRASNYLDENLPDRPGIAVKGLNSAHERLFQDLATREATAASYRAEGRAELVVDSGMGRPATGQGNFIGPASDDLIFYQLSDAGIDIRFASLSASVQGEPTLTFASNSITRDKGSWLADGFRVGQQIAISGTTKNNYPGENQSGLNLNNSNYVIDAVDKTVLRIKGTVLVNEPPIRQATSSVVQAVTQRNVGSAGVAFTVPAALAAGSLDDIQVHVLDFTGDKQDDIVVLGRPTRTGPDPQQALDVGFVYSGTDIASAISNAATANVKISPSLTIRSDVTRRQSVLNLLSPGKTPLVRGESLQSIALGDVNGDNAEDLLVSNPDFLAANGLPDNASFGRAYLILGRSTGGTIYLGSDNASHTTANYVWQGYGVGGRVFAAGDSNRDGYNDFGFARSFESGSTLGSVFLFGGNPTYSVASKPIFDAATNPLNSTSDAFFSELGADRFGVSPGTTSQNRLLVQLFHEQAKLPQVNSGLSATFGDFDGDQLTDIALGDTSTNRVYVYWSAASTPLTSLRKQLIIERQSDVQLQGETTTDNFGVLPLTSHMDLNGDRIADLMIGAPLADVSTGKSTSDVDAGRIYTLLGGGRSVGLPTGNVALLANREITQGGVFLVEQADGQPFKFTGNLCTVLDVQGRLFTAGSLTTDQINDLDRNTLAPWLEDAFRGDCRSLSSTVRIQVKTAGKEWEIIDGERMLVARNESGVLNIYRLDNKNEQWFRFALLGDGQIGDMLKLQMRTRLRLFDLPTVTQLSIASLDNHRVPSSLIDAFARNGIAIAQATETQVLASGRSWQFYEDGDTYIIERVDGSLQIFLLQQDAISRPAPPQTYSTSSVVAGDARRLLPLQDRHYTTSSGFTEGDFALANGTGSHLFELDLSTLLDYVENPQGLTSVSLVIPYSAAAATTGQVEVQLLDMEGDGIFTVFETENGRATRFRHTASGSFAAVSGTFGGGELTLDLTEEVRSAIRTGRTRLTFRVTSTTTGALNVRAGQSRFDIQTARRYGVVAELRDETGRRIADGVSVVDLRNIPAGEYYARVYDPFASTGHVLFENGYVRPNDRPLDFALVIEAPKVGEADAPSDYDLIRGDGANDVLDGGGYRDILFGGSGTDTFRGESLEVRDLLSVETRLTPRSGDESDNIAKPNDVLVRSYFEDPILYLAVADQLGLTIRDPAGILRPVRELWASDLTSLLELDATPNALARFRNPPQPHILRSVRGLEYATNLEYLTLYDQQLASIASLEPGIRLNREFQGELGLGSLRFLDLDQNPLQPGLNEANPPVVVNALDIVGRLRALEFVSLDGLTGRKNDGPGPLRPTTYDFESFGQLTQLKWLSATDLGLVDTENDQDGLGALTHLDKLSFVNLSNVIEAQVNTDKRLPRDATLVVGDLSYTRSNQLRDIKEVSGWSQLQWFRGGEQPYLQHQPFVWHVYRQ